MAPRARKPVDPVLAKLYKARHSVKHPDAKKISDKMYRDRAKSNPEKKKLIQEQTKARVRAFRAKKGKFNKQGLRANPIDLSWLGGMTGRQTSLSVDLINLILESSPHSFFNSSTSKSKLRLTQDFVNWQKPLTIWVNELVLHWFLFMTDHKILTKLVGMRRSFKFD